MTTYYLNFLKFIFLYNKTISQVQNFLGLTSPEFDFVIIAYFITQDKKRKDKIFSGEELYILKNELSYRKSWTYWYLYYKFQSLVSKEYFIFIGNKLTDKNYEMPYYKLNQEKVVYLLSALETFILKSLKPYKNVSFAHPDFDRRLARKDVLKHIKLIRYRRKKK